MTHHASGRRRRASGHESCASRSAALKLTVGIPWYRSDTYAEARALLEDGYLLPPAFDAWRDTAQKIFHEVVARGFRVYRIPIDPHSFAAWCSKHGLEPCHQTSYKYATEQAHHVHASIH